MGNLARKMKRQQGPDSLERERQKANELNKIIAHAMHDQLNQMGLDPKAIDPDKDIEESSVGGIPRKVTHYHYRGVLLVEVVRDRTKKGYQYSVRIPRRDTDGEVIKDKDGHISVN